MKMRNLALGIGGAIGAGIALKMLTRAKSVEWHDVQEFVPHSENSSFVRVDGARVHYQQFGNRANPTIILIHGYGSSAYVWKTAAPLLAEKEFHVIAVDLLGFGYSQKPSWFDYSIGSQARLIARFMNRLSIGSATIVGSSYGGAVAATIALDYPERVEKLVLVGAVCNDEPKNHPLMRLAAIPGIGEVLTPFVTDSKAYLRRRMRRTLARPNHHLITRERVDSVRRPLKAADAHRSLLATARNWSACRVERDASFINQPTLLVWGEDDRVIPISNGYSLHDSILHSRLVVFRECGHVPQEEKAELFANVVSAFCQSANGRLGKDEREAPMQLAG